MYSVYQHWDPLKVCVVGRSYPPEFYSWITTAHVRNLFERIAIETEEDYQAVIKKLHEFGVQTMRPELPTVNFVDNKYVEPPMFPRDHMVMIGETFYTNYNNYNFGHFYWNIRKPEWPDCHTPEDLQNLPEDIKKICLPEYDRYWKFQQSRECYDSVFEHVRSQGNTVTRTDYPMIINGAMVSRIGRDLYFGTESYSQDTTQVEKDINQMFTQTRNHIVNTGGHGDGTYCPVCPGLIISLRDVESYQDTFPGWEVVYLPNQSWGHIKPFLQLKKQNNGRWWIPGFEKNQAVIDTVETWLKHWTGYVEETVFDVNMLLLDPKNVIVFNYNKQVFDALDRYEITPHVIPFRHRYFWDGGIHCITADLHREGVMQDYFPDRT